MAISIEFKVQAVNIVPVSVTVQHDGVDVRASIDCLEVELVSANGRHGSLTARFTGAEVEEAKQKFVPDETVTWAI